MPDSTDDYQRGKVIGKQEGIVEQKLAEYGSHLEKINGSQERIADELRGMNIRLENLTLDNQSLADAAKANERTALALAAALKDADEARRNADIQERSKSEEKWSPLTRISVALGIIVSLFIIGGGLYAIFKQ